MRRPARLLIAAGALAALLGGAAWWARHRASARPKVLLLAAESGPGLDPASGLALGGLLEDELELRAEAPVTTLGRLPEGFHPEAPTLVIRPRVSRQGEDLGLAWTWERWEDGALRPAASGSGGLAGAPVPTLERALDALPLKLAPAPPGLLPQDTGAFWTLVGADAAAADNAGLAAAAERLRRLAADGRGCAAAEAVLAHLETLRVLQDPQPLNGHAALALEAADRAAAAVPGYPRALRYAARLLADQGRQEEAFPRLAEALRRRPDSITLLLALDYCARTAGLLDVAGAARDRMDRLWSGAPVPPPVAFTALYQGHPEVFAASLQEDPGLPPNGFLAFYQGYAYLVQGRREAAAARFQAALAAPATEAHIRALAQVFLLQLKGDTESAARALDALDRSRVGLQVPDGEFTMTMAEAAAFLGQEGRAMDLAQRAFSQGFTCSAWYRQSPLLAKLQALPRWRALLQHVDARRARLAATQRPGTFGL